MKVHDAVQAAISETWSREDVGEDVRLQMVPLLWLESLSVRVDEDVSRALVLDVVGVRRYAFHIIIGNALSITNEVQPTSDFSNYALNPMEVWVDANAPSFIRGQNFENLLFFGRRSNECAIDVTALVKVLCE